MNHSLRFNDSGSTVQDQGFKVHTGLAGALADVRGTTVAGQARGRVRSGGRAGSGASGAACRDQAIDRANAHEWEFAATLLVAAAVSLYVSSLCGSGLKALLIAVPAAFATLPVLELCEGAVYAVFRPTRIVMGRSSRLTADGRTMAVASGRPDRVPSSLRAHQPPLERSRRHASLASTDLARRSNGRKHRRLHGRADVGVPTVRASPAHNRPPTDV